MSDINAFVKALGGPTARNYALDCTAYNRGRKDYFTVKDVIRLAEGDGVSLEAIAVEKELSGLVGEGILTPSYHINVDNENSRKLLASYKKILREIAEQHAQ